MSETAANPVPQHVAVIMDGNGRWAKERHLPRLAGHNAGAKAVERTLKAAQKAGVKFLTLYAFSTENWSRPQDEINGLFKLLEQTLDRYTQDAAKHGVRLLVSGAREPLPPSILAKIDHAVSSTQANTGLTLNLALNYGARQEILHAGKQPALFHQRENLPPVPFQQAFVRAFIPVRAPVFHAVL